MKPSEDPFIPSFNAENDNRSAQVIQIDSGKYLYVVVLCAVLCTVTMPGTIWALYQSSVSERETRMLEYYVMELDGKLMKSGFLNTSESYAGQKEKHK